jgi:hypothetical protein
MKERWGDEGLNMSINFMFWNRVWPGPLQKCWIWKGTIGGKGYGKFCKNKKNNFAHRVSYTIHFGKIPDNKCVLHTCDNRACVNPLHLWLGTNADNMADRNAKGRQAKGETQGLSRLTSKIVSKCRAEHKRGASASFLARKYGVHSSTMLDVVTRHTWKHIP